MDTTGLLLAVVITAACAQDRDAARPLLWNLHHAYRHIRADQHAPPYYPRLRLPATPEAMILWFMIALVTRRLASPPIYQTLTWPGRVAAGLSAALARHGITGIYTAAAEKFALISVTAGLTAWTNGQQIWCTHDGQRRTWPATDIEVGATGLAALTRSGEGS